MRPLIMIVLVLAFCFFTDGALAQQRVQGAKTVKRTKSSGALMSKADSLARSIMEKERAISEKDNIVRRPGEITFTVGAVIEGKVEKPQVIIVFPKEKPKNDTLVFDNSFRSEMLKPLSINAIKAADAR